VCYASSVVIHRHAFSISLPPHSPLHTHTAHLHFRLLHATHTLPHTRHCPATTRVRLLPLLPGLPPLRLHTTHVPRCCTHPHAHHCPFDSPRTHRAAPRLRTLDDARAPSSGCVLRGADRYFALPAFCIAWVKPHHRDTTAGSPPQPPTPNLATLPVFYAAVWRAARQVARTGAWRLSPGRRSQLLLGSRQRRRAARTLHTVTFSLATYLCNIFLPSRRHALPLDRTRWLNARSRRYRRALLGKPPYWAGHGTGTVVGVAIGVHSYFKHQFSRGSILPQHLVRTTLALRQTADVVQTPSRFTALHSPGPTGCPAS